MRQRDKVYQHLYFSYALVSNLVMLTVLWLWCWLCREREQKLLPWEAWYMGCLSVFWMVLQSLVMAWVFFSLYGVVRKPRYRDTLLFFIIFSFWYLPFGMLAPDSQALWISCIFAISPLCFVSILRYVPRKVL